MIWPGLKKEVEQAVKTRNVQVKKIEIESGKAKAHFYKVLSGERRPGPEMIKNLSKSLNISEDYINSLLEKPYIAKTEKIEVTFKDKINKLTPIKKIIWLSLIVLTISITYFFIKVFLIKSDDDLILVSNSEVHKSKIPGDFSKFIKDVTIEDGTFIAVNKKYKKVWRLKNNGSVPWNMRYLMRVTPFSDLVCNSDHMVPIKETLPGEEVDIEVNFTGTRLPGSCRIYWKMVDKYQQPYFPNLHPLYFIVNVKLEKDLIDQK